MKVPIEWEHWSVLLATLETGIEGGKWFRLIDKVWGSTNLRGSLQKVIAKGGARWALYKTPDNNRSVAIANSGVVGP